MPKYVDDNIAALATPYGTGAISVIRVSGKNLDDIIFRLTKKKKLSPRYSTLVNIYSPETTKIIDNCLMLFFPSPDSYTGEDLLEISCHGGEYISRAVLSALYHLGIRAAHAGEFSFRAFMNGKIDLLQAEAINGLIHSKTSAEVSANIKNLSGKLGNKINALRESFLEILSLIEHELDFQEDEITFTQKKDIQNRILKLSDDIHELSSSFIIGKLLSQGIRVPIIGRPNSGKSSLFNAILGHERAIVSDVPGTTRDTLEAWFNLENFSICLVDTAGYWESKDFLENLGIKRTLSEIHRADYLIFVDELNPLSEFNLCNFPIDQTRIVFARTKCDLPTCSQFTAESHIIKTSSKNDEGIGQLITRLSTMVRSTYKNINEENLFLLTARQNNLLNKAKLFIDSVLSNFQSGMEMELLASDLHELLHVLDEVVGTITNKDIIDNIFSNFCVGK